MGNNGKYAPDLTKEDKAKIDQMFWGPYKDAWRDEKGLVDNTDETIANRLNLSLSAVKKYTAKSVDKHFKGIEAGNK